MRSVGVEDEDVFCADDVFDFLLDLHGESPLVIEGIRSLSLSLEKKGCGALDDAGELLRLMMECSSTLREAVVVLSLRKMRVVEIGDWMPLDRSMDAMSINIERGPRYVVVLFGFQHQRQDCFDDQNEHRACTQIKW